ncbi:MAG: aldehyde dehydrogenase [Clostridia bacterium]|nr:aldehyde dehydrogenase [Clostridia bacterium]
MAEDYGALISAQRAYFQEGATLPLSARRAALKTLYEAIVTHEAEIAAALAQDLGKGTDESYMCEIGMVRAELTHMLKHMGKYARAKRVRTPLAQFPSKSYTLPVPRGTVLIMSPWNYPFLLTVGPLIDAIAAGNTAIVKPSAYSPATSAVIKSLVEKCFPRELVAVVTGGRAENAGLLGEKFDLVFFTGSGNVGREVLRRCAEHLTPAVLELGGKSPCIVEKTANVALAARRIVFGKYLNCGQTCVAPDYILCDVGVAEELLAALKKEIAAQFGDTPLALPDYGKIINEKHFDRLLGLIDREKLAHGGETNRETLQIAPTVLKNVTWEDAVMGEEIFGPVLPLLTYDTLDEALAKITERDKPLALYLFTKDKKIIKRVTAEVPFGGGCINDVIIHLATTEMGFGGVGESGMGAYHGRVGFETFSHRKSIVKKSTHIDLPMRYRPYGKGKSRLIRRFLK